MFLLLATACTEGPGPVADEPAPAPAGSPAPLPGGGAPVDAPRATDALCQLDMRCDVLPTRDTKVPCTLRVTREDGRVDFDGAAEMWVRGRSSAQVVKPGYGVELRGDDGATTAADLLEMGKESDWVIDGLWYDRLLVRDKLGYDLFRELGGGNYAAESALCELTRNGDYYGVHALVERVKRDDDRIDIADGTDDGAAFVLTQLDEDCFYTNTLTYGCWKLVSPGTPTADGAAAITAWLAGWEAEVVDAAASGAWDEVWRLTELDSVVDVVIVEELFKNEDAWYTSLKAYKPEDGGLRFVPWDLDMTFGQFPGYGTYGESDVWIHYRPLLWQIFAASPAVRARLPQRWEELRRGPLEETTLLAHIDALQAILGDAIVRNDERWPIEAIDYAGLFYPVGSYAEEDDHVRAWLGERLRWMDEHIDAY